MMLRNGEYEIDGDRITIPRRVLEEFRDHYRKVSVECSEKGNKLQAWFYMGKADVCVGMLKMFDQLEL